MKTIMYAVFFDNNMPYEDHFWTIEGYYTTKEEAEKHVAHSKMRAEKEYCWWGTEPTWEVVERELLTVFIPEETEQ